MLTLSLVWVFAGTLIGTLASVARGRRTSRGRWGWLAAMGIGILAALLGGWLGTLVLGRYFGTATALWVAILVAAAVSWLTDREGHYRVPPAL